MKSSDRGGGGGGGPDLYDCVGGSGGGGGVSHPLSSANPPGLPRPPLHPLQQHTPHVGGHNHTHMVGVNAGTGTISHNGSPMQRMPHHAHHVNHVNQPQTMSQPQSQPQTHPPQQLVSNGLNGHNHATHQGAQTFGESEQDNEKWWWVCCLEFCFCLL